MTGVGGVREAAQRGDVGAGDAQNRQFREALAVRERGHGAPQRLEGGADRVDPRPLARVGLLPPLAGHVLQNRKKTQPTDTKSIHWLVAIISKVDLDTYITSKTAVQMDWDVAV